MKKKSRPASLRTSSRAPGSTLDTLRRFESPNVTYLADDGAWPIVWTRARGSEVWDEYQQKYLDLTAAFGVAASGHANPRIVRAGQKQMETLLHAMGDVHPHPGKAELARELSRLTFSRWKAPRRQREDGKAIFGSSGFEAVEAALKTAVLATGRKGVVAFDGAYHGLGYGALNVTHREHFRGPFQSQLRAFGVFFPYPATRDNLAELESSLRLRLQEGDVGAILVEPIQARAGIRVPPQNFLRCLQQLATEAGALLILDEIYTGFGRTGRWFACEHAPAVVPDLICLGKALAGGFPLSACLGRASVMDAAWPRSTGEAIHTSTFFGHPVGCAMALAQMQELRREKLISRSARLGEILLNALREIARTFSGPKLFFEARGVGLMAGLEIWSGPERTPATSQALAVIQRLLRRGFILLPEGEFSNVISFTPPLVISEAQLRRVVRALEQEIAALAS